MLTAPGETSRTWSHSPRARAGRSGWGAGALPRPAPGFCTDTAAYIRCEGPARRASTDTTPHTMVRSPDAGAGSNLTDSQWKVRILACGVRAACLRSQWARDACAMMNLLARPEVRRTQATPAPLCSLGQFESGLGEAPIEEDERGVAQSAVDGVIRNLVGMQRRAGRVDACPSPACGPPLWTPSAFGQRGPGSHWV